MGGYVLIVGGSGYLGLHLLQALSSLSSPSHLLAFTYHSHHPPKLLLQKLPNARAFHVDLHSGEGLQAIASALGHPRVVVNCAALSIPRDCEINPSLAMAVNVPHTLLQWMSSFSYNQPPLLVQFSTDQVYEGTKSFYKEDDETNPVNVYGKSKLTAEKFIQENWVNFVILRSSIIYGPQPMIDVPKSLPIQWIDALLSNNKDAEFFDDEFRCPVFVKDVLKVVELLIAKETSETSRLKLILNLGGPNRVSRAEMAEVVADIRGIDKSLVKHVSAASVNRGVPSPSDISMDVSKLVSTMGMTLTPFRVGVELTLRC